MKKIITLVVLFACSLLVFAGCGYEGGSEVKGIAFTAPIYYVDENVPFKLNYRVFPSTSDTSNAYVYFEAHDTVNLGKYSFDVASGIITVNQSADFRPMEVSVVCGDYSDTCEIRVKEYPSIVEFAGSEVHLSAGAMTELSLVNEFGERVDSNFYNIKVTSSDPTIVSVEDSSLLMVKSTGKKGSATIACEFFNSNNQKMSGLECQTTVTIANNVENAVIDIAGNYIKDFSAVLNFTGVVGEEYDISPIFMDEDGFVVPDDDFSIVSLNENVIKVEKTGNDYKLVILASGSAKIIVSSSVYGADGNLVVFTLNCGVTIST